MIKNKMLLLAVILTTMLTLCACTTMVPINPSPKSITSNIRVGDNVRVASQEHVYNFRVTKVTKQKISGENITIPIKRIDTIARKDPDATKTACAAGGGVVVGIGVAVVAALAGVIFIIF